MKTCHICNSRLVVCTDVFDRSYCYPHGRAWFEHIAKAIGDGDVSRWCEHGGLAGPAAVVVADDGRTDAGPQDVATGNQAANAGCRRGLMEEM